MKKMKMILPMVLLVGGLSGCANQNSVSTYESLVTMDVNPGIQLKLDNNDRVIEALAVNADAEVLLKDMDLTKADAKVAVNALLGGLVKEGYLTTDNNTVLLSVENKDEQKRVQLEKLLSEEIQGTLKDLSIDGAILSQNLDIDDEIEKLIAKYDISYGKATLIEEILDENKKSYTIEDLVKLDAQDLVLIYQQEEARDEVKDEKREMSGTVSTSKYIGKDEALDIVLKDAGLTKSQVKELEVEYDSERGVLTYEIDFEYGNKDYDYEVNAVTGAIEKEVEIDDDRPSSSSDTTQTNTKTDSNTTTQSDTNTSTNTVTTKSYTQDEVLTLVLKDAVLAKDQVKNLRIEKDDGMYEIDFDYGNKEYSYDVHPTKGIVDKDVEAKDDKPSSQTTSNNTTTTKQYTKEEALALALKDVGLNKEQVQNLKVESDDQGYDVEFDYSDKEYSYDIHFTKGIVDKEVDRRD